MKRKKKIEIFDLLLEGHCYQFVDRIRLMRWLLQVENSLDIYRKVDIVLETKI